MRIGFDRPVVTKMNVTEDILRKSVEIADLIESKYSDTVSGVWYLTESGNSGETRIVVKSVFDIESIERSNLFAKIQKIFNYENLIIYDYNREVEGDEETAYGNIRKELENSYVIMLREQ